MAIYKAARTTLQANPGNAKKCAVVLKKKYLLLKINLIKAAADAIII